MRFLWWWWMLTWWKRVEHAEKVGALLASHAAASAQARKEKVRVEHLKESYFVEPTRKARLATPTREGGKEHVSNPANQRGRCARQLPRAHDRDTHLHTPPREKHPYLLPVAQHVPTRSCISRIPHQVFQGTLTIRASKAVLLCSSIIHDAHLTPPMIHIQDAPLYPFLPFPSYTSSYTPRLVHVTYTQHQTKKKRKAAPYTSQPSPIIHSPPKPAYNIQE